MRNIMSKAEQWASEKQNLDKLIKDDEGGLVKLFVKLFLKAYLNHIPEYFLPKYHLKIPVTVFHKSVLSPLEDYHDQFSTLIETFQSRGC